MKSLRDFKVPNFKFPKFKMKDISEIEEMNMDYETLEKSKENQKKKDKKEFIATEYNDIKEILCKNGKPYTGSKENEARYACAFKSVRILYKTE